MMTAWAVPTSWRPWALPLVIALLLPGCASDARSDGSFPEIQDWDTVRISLSRSVCFGTCPAYEVEIAGDGTVVFEGDQHVALAGRHEARIPREEVAALVERFREANFFSLKDEYVAGVTDVPSYRISISFDSHEKSVMDHFGHEVGMPAAVTALEDEIDRVAGTARWIEG